MKHRYATGVAAALAMVGLPGCGGQWVGAPDYTASCESDLDGIRKEVKENDIGVMLMLSQYCTVNGKKFTGDVRCDSGNLQVKCK